jgi:iron(III) transport system permease protein
MRSLRKLSHDPALAITVAVIFALLGLFIVYPLVRVFVTSLFYRGEFNPKYFIQFLHRTYLFRPLLNSLTVGALVAGIGTTIGFLFAYAVTRTDIPGKPLFRVIATFPVISPPFLLALAAILLLGNHGLITEYFKLRWDIYGLPGLVLTETLAYFPLAFMALEGVLASIDPALEESALDLGASKVRTFFRVTLPLAIPGIASALLLVFIRSLEDFGNPIVIQGKFQVLTVQAFLAITGMYNLPLGATLAIVLLVPTLVAFLLQRYWVGRRSFVTVTGRPSGAALRRTSPLGKTLLLGALGLISGVILLFYGLVVYGSFTRLWGVDNSFTLENYRYVFSTGAEYLLDTLKIAGVAAPIGGVLAVVIAYLVVRKKFPGRGAMDFLSMLSFAVPGTLVGLGYVLAFNQPPFRLTGTAAIIALVFIFRRMPVGIRDAVAMLQQIDPAIDEAATDLGGGLWRTFRRIALPLIAPAFISGMTYIFVRCVTAISAVIFVVSAQWQLITVALLHEVDNADLSQAAAYGVVIILVVLIAILLLDQVLGKLLLRRYGAHR